MGVLTTLLKLSKPSENDYYNQQTEQADNWDKVDNYAVLTNTDKNGIWGGEYGGKIQDPIPKELNKRYIDNINGKAFICIKAGGSSVVSNTIEYFTPCNVVDNLAKLQNLAQKSFSIQYDNSALFTNLVGQVRKVGRTVEIEITGNLQPKSYSNTDTLHNIIPINFRPISRKRIVLLGANTSSLQTEMDINPDGSIKILYSNEIHTSSKYVQFCGMYFTE